MDQPFVLFETSSSHIFFDYLLRNGWSFWKLRGDEGDNGDGEEVRIYDIQNWGDRNEIDELIMDDFQEFITPNWNNIYITRDDTFSRFMLCRIVIH